MEPSHDLAIAFREEPSPERLAAPATRLVAEMSGTPLETAARQKASDYLLRAHLLQANPNLGEVARHAEVLLSTGYPDARILVPTLDVLNGHWSAERLAQARQQIREAARVPSLGKDCGANCSAEQIVREIGDPRPLSALERFEVDQAVALSRL
jgi:hypothetical protein